MYHFCALFATGIFSASGKEAGSHFDGFVFGEGVVYDGLLDGFIRFPLGKMLRLKAETILCDMGERTGKSHHSEGGKLAFGFGPVDLFAVGFEKHTPVAEILQAEFGDAELGEQLTEVEDSKESGGGKEYLLAVELGFDACLLNGAERPFAELLVLLQFAGAIEGVGAHYGNQVVEQIVKVVVVAIGKLEVKSLGDSFIGSSCLIELVVLDRRDEAVFGVLIVGREHDASEQKGTDLTAIEEGQKLSSRSGIEVEHLMGVERECIPLAHELLRRLRLGGELLKGAIEEGFNMMFLSRLEEFVPMLISEVDEHPRVNILLMQCAVKNGKCDFFECDSAFCGCSLLHYCAYFQCGVSLLIF